MLMSGTSFASAPFCLPFASLRLQARDCDDNFALGKQADSCLSLYTKAVTAKKKEVEQMLKAEAAKGKAQQSGTFNTAGSVFDRTAKELDQLIQSGEQAKLAVGSMSDNLSLPEDYDQPQVTGMSTEKYLSIEPCYATPKRVISEDGAVLSLMVDDLKKAKADVLAKGGVVQGSSKAIQNGSGSTIINGKAAPAAQLPKASKVKNRESDVSGTIKPEQK
jgi:hypothetical protein